MAIKKRSGEKKTYEAKKEPKKPKGKQSKEQSSQPDLFTEESPPPSVILESIQNSEESLNDFDS